MNDDLIRRSDAIRVANGFCHPANVAEELAALPAVKPVKYEWCHDCKEYDQEAHCCPRWTSTIKRAIDSLDRAVEETGRAPARWVRLHGFATPGGDPVWACSQCGKGIHVYGIEAGTYNHDISDGQWKACPNCGAFMMGEICDDEGCD